MDFRVGTIEGQAVSEADIFSVFRRDSDYDVEMPIDQHATAPSDEESDQEPIGIPATTQASTIDGPAPDHTARLAAGRECLTAAIEYTRLGLAVVPVCDPHHVSEGKEHGQICKSPGKCPTCKWKPIIEGQRLTEDELTNYWRRHPTRNVGLICGAVSNVVGIDVDGERGLGALADVSGGDLPETVEFQTGGGGRRLIYSIPAGIKLKTTHNLMPDGEHEGLSYLGNGGHTVLPPSRHNKGGRYVWAPGKSIMQCSPAPAPAWLVRKLTAYENSASKNGHANQNGRATTEEYKPYDARVVVDGCAWLQHARDDAATLPEPEWCAMVRTLGRGTNGAEVVHELSAPYPGYSVAETDRKIAESLSQKPRTCASIIEMTQGRWCDGCPVRNKVNSPVALGVKREAKPKKVEYQLVTCRELDAAEYDLEYLIETFLVARQPCIFAGGKKTLKTSLLIALAISLAMGVVFLGRFTVRRAVRVLMMTGESGMATIQETARRVAAAMGLDLADIGNLIFSPDLPVFGHLEHMDSLAETLTANEIEVLIVDPAYLAMPTEGNEGSLFAMGALLRSMATLCQKLGITFVLAHHCRKTLTDPFAPPELEDIAWAGFNEFARQWVLVGRRERYEPGSGQHYLWVNAGGSAGHSSCWALDVSEGVYDGHTPRQWQVSLKRAEEARQDAEQRQQGERDQKRQATSAAQLEADRKTIVAVMIKMPDRTGTKTEIRERSHLSTPRVSTAIASLADDNVVVECDTTKGNNRPYPAWKLKGDTDE